tara:strand:+ start:6822 stop:6989 length:168 start_codon:yes stop_codon:yes gene_type:complete
MDLKEKLIALEKQAEELKGMFMKVMGAIELTKTLIDEESSDAPAEDKPEDKPEEG